MSGIIRCSKLRISSDTKEIIIKPLLLLLAMLVFENSTDKIISYFIGTFIVMIFIDDIFNLSKRVKAKLDVEKLLEEYKKSEYWSDKRYEEKQIKLKGIVQNIKFYESKNILKINLKCNDIYTLEARAFNLTKKCIKYIENISIGKEITIYGEFTREENQMYIDMRYLK